MKNITSTLNGLASSLLHNAGFAQMAEKMDPVSHQAVTQITEVHGPAACYPSTFTAKPRK
jgi:hypothetical protein